MPEALDDKKIADFRRRICEVATRQFAHHGADKVSMRSLAKELGYSATALYSYYRNKEEILAATRAAALERLVPRLQAAVDGCDHPRDQLLAVGGAYLEFSANEPAAYQLIFSPGQEANSTELDVATDRVRRIFTACVERLLHQQGFSVDAGLHGQAFWSTMHGAVALRTAGKLAAGTDFERFYQSTLQLMVAAVSTDAGTATAPTKTGQQFSFDL